MNFRTTLLAILLLFSVKAMAEKGCMVTGNVVNQNNDPLPYASVLVKAIPTNGDKGGTTDDKGYFCIQGLADGEYQLFVSYMGFESFLSEKFRITGGMQYDFKQIQLIPTHTNLSDIVVTGMANVSEIKPTYIKYKTSALVSQSGGNAGDILKNMPSVAMGGSPGHNRDIRFRGLGNAYTKVLINGRETGFKGNNRESVLDQIPASSISHIEIMSVPGVEYQAEGLNGVVNIILKDNANYGTHGHAEIMGGNYDGLTGSVGLSNKTEKLNLYANFDFQQRRLPKDKDKIKNSLDASGSTTQIEENIEFEDKSFDNKSLRGGLEYYFMPRTKFLGEYTYGYQLEDKDKTNDITKYDANRNFKSATQELKTEYKPNTYHQTLTALEHTFGNNTKLSADFGYLTSEQDKKENKTTYTLNKLGKWANFQPAREKKRELIEGDEYTWNLSLSNLAVGKHLIKAGYSGKQEKKGFTINTDKFNYKDTSWTRSVSGFDNFRVTETTQAFYANDDYKFSIFRAKAGIRYELTSLGTNATLQENSGYGDYGIFLPNVSLTANIDKSQYLTANWGRRIRRPGFKDLNPYEEEKETGSYKKGNPDLEPELAWAYELGYLKNFNKFNIGANVFYRDISKVIQKNLSEDADGNITEQPQNTGSAWLRGVEITSNIAPFKFWELNASYSYFESEITSGDYQGDALTDQYKWSAKAINDFKLPFAATLQIAFNAVDPKVSGTKEENTIWFADLGIQKKIMGNGSIVFRMTDVFDSLQKDKTEYTSASTTFETEKSVGRVYFVGVNWKF